MDPIHRKILQALAATLALPAVACSTSDSSSSGGATDAGEAGDIVSVFDSPGGGCTLVETPNDAFTLADGTLDSEAGPNAACFDQCTDADPVGKRVCCYNASYQCDDDGGAVTCHAYCQRAGGRGSEGVRVAPTSHLLAQLAQLEAASVPAFARLRAELRSHGAPRSLLRASSRARRDEVRHARTMKALARRRGGTITAPTIDATSTRSIEALAIENVVEGCVHETYGALLAHWQSMHARDREVRDAMKRIARDETRHAALAWKAHRWMDRRLDRSTRARIDEARRAATAKLRSELTIEPDSQAIRDLGVPSAQHAVALLDALTS
jgi:hypothetical protein